MDKECDYEMHKATASAPLKDSVDARAEELYIECMELKGGRLLRRHRVPAQ